MFSCTHKQKKFKKKKKNIFIVRVIRSLDVLWYDFVIWIRVGLKSDVRFRSIKRWRLSIIVKRNIFDSRVVDVSPSSSSSSSSSSSTNAVRTGGSRARVELFIYHAEKGRPPPRAGWRRRVVDDKKRRPWCRYFVPKKQRWFSVKRENRCCCSRRPARSIYKIIITPFPPHHPRVPRVNIYIYINKINRIYGP